MNELLFVKYFMLSKMLLLLKQAKLMHSVDYKLSGDTIPRNQKLT